MTETTLAPLPERFNFAQHLLQANAQRGSKAAFVDDLGSVSYAQLDERVRRVAAGLRGLGIRREERVLLLMLDSNDWPVSFLGAMYAGLVPVADLTLARFRAKAGTNLRQPGLALRARGGEGEYGIGAASHGIRPNAVDGYRYSSHPGFLPSRAQASR